MTHPSKPRMFCSDSCSRQARQGRLLGEDPQKWDARKCKFCDTPFRILLRATMAGRGKFCSKECCRKDKKGRATGRAAKCTYWLGYRFIRRPEDNKRVLEHRDVMERHLGRKLERGEHVHHKNHNRSDNRLENLEVLQASEHMKHHVNEMTSEELRVRAIAGAEGLKRKTQAKLRPRNEIIIARRSSGESAASIASDFGLTAAMVRTISRGSIP